MASIRFEVDRFDIAGYVVRGFGKSGDPSVRVEHDGVFEIQGTCYERYHEGQKWQA